MQVRPVGRNVLIRPLKDSITYKGLALPDTAKARASDGIILQLGPRCVLPLLPGDWVVFSRKQARDVENDGIACVIVNEQAITLVLDETEGTKPEPPLCTRCGTKSWHSIEGCVKHLRKALSSWHDQYCEACKMAGRCEFMKVMEL